MSVISVLGKLRKLVGKLTDILIRGREAGLWTKKPGVGSPGDKPHDPTFPDIKGYR